MQNQASETLQQEIDEMKKKIAEYETKSNERIVIYRRKVKELEELNQREQLLKDKGFYDFYVGCKKLVDVWFFGGEYDELSQKMEEYILKAGVYGDRENWVAVQQVKKGGGTVKHLFRRLFPPYKDMILIYPKLKGRK